MGEQHFDWLIQFKEEYFVVTYAWRRSETLQQLLINNLKSRFAQVRHSWKDAANRRNSQPTCWGYPMSLHAANKPAMKPQWNCFESSIRTLKHSISTMGTTLHPVSELAWGEGVPEGNMYLAFAYFPFHHLTLHAKKRRRRSRVAYLYFPLRVIFFVFAWAIRMPKFSSWNDE